MSDFTPKPDLEVLNKWPIGGWEWPRIVVFVPMMGALLYADKVFGRLWAIAQQGTPFLPLGSDVTHVVRNRAGEALLMSDFTHILMLDADHLHQVDIVQRMARRVIQDPSRKVVAGLYFNRRPPYEPLAWARDEKGHMCRIEEWGKGLIESIDLCGTGCLLIAREVFEQIERPWFWYDYDGIQEAKGDFIYPTEDIWFCNKVREAGIKIALDTTVDMPHASMTWVNEKTYRDYAETNAAVSDRKVQAIAKYLGINLIDLEEQVALGGLSVQEAWQKANPQTAEEVEAFYGSKDSGYFYDLLYWNSTPQYQKIIKPLKKVKEKSVLIVGPGIGGEIDALLGMGNKIAVYELSGALRDFLKEYYQDEISYAARFDEYDLVVAIDVIEHVHPDILPSFLNTLLEMLKPGGYLYCHNNFSQQDLYPMHYAENEAVFDAWIAEHFRDEGNGSYVAL